MSALADQFREDGLAAVYTCTLNGNNDEAAHSLDEAVEWLLNACHPRQTQVVLVGCAGGGLLARRYVVLGGSRRAAWLFTVGSTHTFSLLSFLDPGVFERQYPETSLPDVESPVVDQTTLVNIYSGLISSRRLVQLPDAVNLSLPVEEEVICRAPHTYQVMRRCLRGDFWMVTVRLKRLEMRGAPDAEGRSGPFCFEVNGWRTPFDGVFRAPLQRAFDLDPARALLATVPFPKTNAGRAVDVTFRLKDLTPAASDPGNPQPPERRKLVASLHTPLRADQVAEYALQDSLGSEIVIQIRCDSPRSFLEAGI